MIEQEAIDQNYHMAMEEAPEVFARVSMLYIDTEVRHGRPFPDAASVRVRLVFTRGRRTEIMPPNRSPACLCSHFRTRLEGSFGRVCVRLVYTQ